MANNVMLPQWGMNMEEGTLVKWLVAEGDEVDEGQPLVEIETAKINSELESPTSGVVAHIMESEGSTVKVGTLVAVIGAPGENPPRPEAVSRRRARAPRPQSSAPAASGARVQVTPVARRLARQNDISLDNVAGTGPNGRITEDDVRAAIAQRDQPAGRVQVVPAARLMARRNNLDLAQIEGTGPGGRILVEDVEREIADSPAAAVNMDAVAETIELTGLRKTIADRMSMSVHTMAQVTLTTEIDVTEIVDLRDSLVSSWRAHRLRPLVLDIMIVAVADALQKHPRLNAHLVDGNVHLLKGVDIGLAMAVPDGLMVPVLKDAASLSLIDAARAMRDLADRLRKNLLTIDDMTGAGFAITSLSAYDIDAFTPIIDPPQVAILGLGRVTKKPAVHDGEIAVRSMMHASVTFDHRALDGVPVAEFMRTLKSNLGSTDWLGQKLGES
ncbi:MAG: 2-oxo acid dehydrogenase subunit E2 [SAR202 cluster bacterium]|jgi:pyruvate dehydrogenase E2 component (dihydrolipoamide acetyltransferase)|nr:dehydrogenase [Chloroflexota bacterium]MDP6420894.1 dihydrolipoamide acetyltransferase family protein [SAR202 cluster bacterium]MQG57829.1 2-oxo acid dehydrogenase subunit E2 [SAR202 cluster bacterium]MQG68119.1 2-oxo acid dehydrogenase subunit E2 [SAR202 cluster bacterium]|tara:strand:+ start:3210 stop:4538 length:1329 start_codon:yes stop_codon:yes gene_type:complete